MFRCYYRRQKKIGKVPSTFPGTVGLLVSDNNDGIASLVNQYRRYGEEKNEEFYYFVTRILPAINPGADFKRLMKEKLISDIFSVTDEAFGLIILHNEYHVWVSQQEEGYTGRNDGTKLKKQYTDVKSGKDRCGIVQEEWFLMTCAEKYINYERFQKLEKQWKNS